MLTLRLKLLAIVTLPPVCVVLMLLLFAGRYNVELAKHSSIQNVEAIVLALSQSFERIYLLDDQRNAADIVTQLQSFPSIRQLEVLSDGDVIFAYRHPDEGAAPFREIDAFEPQCENGSLEVVVPIDSAAAPNLRVQVRSSTERVDQVARSSRTAMTLVGAAILGVGLIAVLILQQFISRPIEALHQAETRFRSVLEAAPDAIVLVDREGSIVLVNSQTERLFGYDRNELLGRPVETLIPERFSLRHPELIDSYFAAPEIRPLGQGMEVRAMTRGGTEIPVEISLGPVETPDGVIACSTIRDVTVRKQAEAEREELHRRLQEVSREAGMAEIARGVLHNIGNVLNSVNVSTSLLSEKVSGLRLAAIGRVAQLIDENRSNLGSFLESDDRGRQLPAYLAKLSEHLSADQTAVLEELKSLSKNIDHIKQVVALQQVHSKGARPQETVSISELLDDAVKMNAISLERHHITIERDYGDIPPVLTDKHKLLQILINVIKNAKDAVRGDACTDPRIRLRSMAKDADLIQIMISDNGCGIEPEHMDAIYRAGFTTKQDGTGYGLHTCALSIDDLGGAMRAESDGNGRGATFIIEIPVESSLQESTA